MSDKKANFNELIAPSMQNSGDTLGKGVLLDIPKDICAICRNHLKQLCIDCEEEQGSHLKKLEEMCPEVTGKCNHVFHWHCISPWLKTKSACPLDYGTWEFKYTGKENQKF